MGSAIPHRAATGLDHQLDLLSEGADIASRNLERLISTQFDGCRDWLKSVKASDKPGEHLEQHLDHGLQLGCALFVAQVSAMTDAMQLMERAMAEQHRTLLGQIAQQAPQVGEPLKQVLCISGCGYDSLSKATRQVANFASNRFAAATVSAFQQARDKMSEVV
ncbi:hypothetical protein [Chitinimonas sp.]|uniref:hypothetical protein n=1 Tax=Chitinimonas sp. TaxID=1934313 RepID=UPI0035B02D91